MALTITRTYEADVDSLGFGIDEDEVHIGTGTLHLGLSTNASDFNNLASGTTLTITQGDVSITIEITSRFTVSSELVRYGYTLESGTIDFDDGVQATIEIVISPPTWQTGSSLQSDIDALATTSIDIAALVSDEDDIELIDNGYDWATFDGTTLEITRAPIYRADTVIRFKFDATNDGGTERGIYELTVNASRLVHWFSTLLFKPALNYDGDRVEIRGESTIVREMTDNSYLTFSTEDDVDIDVSDADDNATTITHIFLKTKNVDSYSFTPSGGSGSGFTDREMPTEYRTLDGRDQTSEIRGFQHEFYPLPADVTATSVRLQFTGTDVEVYAVMLLELIKEIRDGEFLSIEADKVDRTGSIQGAPRGSVRRVSPIGSQRWKWEVDYNLKIRNTGTAFDSVDAFTQFVADNPEIVHAQEPSRYPDRIHPAEITSLEITPEVVSRAGYQVSGGNVSFTIAER